MGPKLFGDFAILLSILALLVLSSSWAGLVTFGRFVPQLQVSKQISSIKGLFTEFFILRLLFAFPVIALFFILSANFQWITDYSIMVAIGVAYIFGSMSMSCFQLFFGLNKMGRFLLHGSSSKIILVLVLLSYWQPMDIKIAAYSIAFVEVLLATILIVYARKYFSISAAIDQWPFFRSRFGFGFKFFLSNFLLVIIWRSGEIIIGIFSTTGEQVAFYNLSNSMFLAFNMLFGQIGLLLLPSINAINDNNDLTKRDYWLDKLFVYTTVITMLLLLLVYCMGAEILSLLLGDEYSEVINNLKVILFALVPLSFIRLGQTIAVVKSRAKDNFIVAAISLSVFIISSVFLSKTYGALGVSFSVVAAFCVSAIFSFYRFKLAQIINLFDFLKIIAVGFSFIIFLELSHFPRIEAGVVLSLAFVLLMFLLRVITINDILKMVTKR